jgi:peptidyl-prolyl cis-trans isomerase D
MLNFIRERIQGWLAYVIVGLLVIPFALWGINEYLGNGGSLVVANVNNTEINQRDFQRAFYSQRDRMRQALGKQYDSSLFDPQIKKRVIRELVDQELLLQNADDVGYRISETTIAATIRNIESFREDGVFSTELYEQQVQAQGQSAIAFEQRVHRMMLTGQLTTGLSSTVLVTDVDIDAAIRLQEQTRSVQYLVLPVKKYRDESIVDEASIKSYYESNSDQFKTAERVRVEYIELSLASIAASMAKNTPPTEKQLREFFEKTAGQYSAPEERQARHILIEVGEGSKESVVNAAREKATNLLTKIKAGESFEKLAKENSDDPGSSDMGGDLGFFGRGIMEPDFEKAAFALNVGEVSEPVLTSFGFHLIKIEQISKPESKKFEDVRKDLAPEFQKDEAERKYFDLADKLTNMAYETPDSLSEVADQLELDLKQSPFIGRNGGAGIFANPRIATAAFSEDVLTKGYNSEPLDVGQNHVVVLRMFEHQKASLVALETVQDKVKKLLVQTKAKEATKEAGANAVKQLQAKEENKNISNKLGVAWEKTSDINRKSTTIDAAVVRQAFRMTKPAADAVSYDGVVLRNGDYAIIALINVAEGDPASVDKAARETIKNQLANEMGANVQDHLLTTLRSHASVNVQEDDL